MELDRHGAELLFQVLTEREEAASVAIASNESFSKAHMFAATCAGSRRDRTSSGADEERVDACSERSNVSRAAARCGRDCRGAWIRRSRSPKASWIRARSKGHRSMLGSPKAS